MFISIAILAAGPYLAECCVTGLHPAHMRNVLQPKSYLEKRRMERIMLRVYEKKADENTEAEVITVPSKNTTHWTVAENLREMQVTDDAFIAQDLPHYNHAPSVQVYNSGGSITNLTQHFDDMASLYSMFPNVDLQNHNYPVRFGEGDWTVTLTRVSGTNSGPLPGFDGNYMTPTRRDMYVDFMTIGRWEYGLLQDEYLFQDTVRMYRQLGLFPSPPRTTLQSIVMDAQGDVGTDAATLNKMRANVSDTYFNSGSSDADQLFYSANLTVYGLSDDPMNLSDYMSFLNTTRQAFPDLNYTHQQVIAQGEWTATLGMLSGTQQGSWTLPPYVADSPIPATGNRFNLLHYVIARWSNGEIVEMQVLFDTIGVITTLGIQL